MPSRFIPIAAGTDPSQQLATINKNFGELDAENVKKLFYDANGTPSIQIGVQQDGSSRIRIAKAGIDVTMATDDQLAFNSAQNSLKVAQSGTTTVTAVLNQTSFGSITHNLGFVPIVIATCQSPAFFPGNAAGVPYMSSITTASKVMATLGNITTTTLQFAVELGTGPTGSVGDWTFKYFLLQETAV